MDNLKTIGATLFKIIGRKGKISVENKGRRVFTQRPDYSRGYEHRTEHGCEILITSNNFNELTCGFGGEPSIWICDNGYASGEVYISDDKLVDKDTILERAKTQVRNKAKKSFGQW